MALHEGRCTNCGSILMLNKDQELGHCLYCDAVFPTSDALKLAENADGYVFPNLPQEKYEGPNLDPLAAHVSFIPAAKPSGSRAAEKTAPAEKFVPSGEKIPDLNIPLKKKLAVIAVTLAFCLLFAAVMLPLSLRRDRYRAEIVEKLDLEMLQKDSASKAEMGETIEFHGLNNNTVIIVTDSEIDREQAENMYRHVCSMRAEVMGAESKDEKDTFKNVELRVASSKGNGGWVVDYSDTEGIQSKEFMPEKTEAENSATES